MMGHQSNREAAVLGAGVVAGLLLGGVAGTSPALAQWGVSATSALGSTTEGGRGGVIRPGETEITRYETDMGMDPFLRVGAGAEYLAEGRRGRQHLSYTFASFLHLNEAQTLSFNNDATWTGTVNPGRDTDLSLALGGSHGRTGDLYLFDRLRLGESAARPSSSVDFVGANGVQSFGWRMGPFWWLSESLSGQIFHPLGGDDQGAARTLGADAELGFGRRFDETSIGLQAGAGHGRSSAYRVGELWAFPARRASYGELSLTWDQSLTDEWSTHLRGGVLRVQVPQVRAPFVDLSFDAAISYRTPTGGDVTVQGNRGVVTNVFVGDVLLQTGVGVRLTHFFGRNESWQITGGGDYQRGRSVFVVDFNQGGLEVATGLVTANYQWTRNIILEIEANYTYQDAEASQRGPMFIPDSTMHRVMTLVSLAYVFPQPDELTGGGVGRRRPRRLPGKTSAGGDVGMGLEGDREPGRGDRPMAPAPPATTPRPRRDPSRAGGNTVPAPAVDR